MPLQDDETAELPPELDDPRAKTLHHLRWLIQMRWAAIVIVGSVIVISIHVLRVLPSAVTWPLVLLTGALALLNVFYGRLVQSGQFQTSRLLTFQLYCDLFFFSALVHFSGGLENPASVLIVFNVVIAGMLLGRRSTYRFVAAASVLSVAFAFAEWGGSLPHYTLSIFPHGGNQHVHASKDLTYVASRTGTQIVVMATIAYFVSMLADRAADGEKSLLQMTKRALAERRLLERSLATARTGLRVVGAGLRPEWANEHWRAYFGDGLSVEVAPGGPDESARLTLDDGRARVHELDLGEGAGAQARVFQVTTAPLEPTTASPRRVVQLVQDITERARVRSQVLEAGKLAAVGELAGHVAHEVNNPIGIISAKARLLLARNRADMSDRVADEISKIIELSDRVASIARDLLSYCRPSPAARAPVPIQASVQRALETVSHLMEKANIELVAIIPNKPLIVTANDGQLQQIFLNLLLNAIDAMPEGGTMTVVVELDPGGTQAMVNVEDTGTGIDESARARIFDPFFSTKAEGHGTGLGLAVCSGLVNSHQGSIEVDSELGRGSRFVVRLPLLDERRAKED